jgi:phosphoribosyl-AMP cyclohydrolase
MEYNLKLNEAGLIPVIVTDAKTGEVLMLTCLLKVVRELFAFRHELQWTLLA